MSSENKLPYPTKEQFLAYRRVQFSGKYNMVTEAKYAAMTAGLDLDTYSAILWNYTALCFKYLSL